MFKVSKLKNVAIEFFLLTCAKAAPDLLQYGFTRAKNFADQRKGLIWQKKSNVLSIYLSIYYDMPETSKDPKHPPLRRSRSHSIKCSQDWLLA